eukprot:5448173-Prymnesium_polylepis.1
MARARTRRAARAECACLVCVPRVRASCACLVCVCGATARRAGVQTVPSFSLAFFQLRGSFSLAPCAARRRRERGASVNTQTTPRARALQKAGAASTKEKAHERKPKRGRG